MSWVLAAAFLLVVIANNVIIVTTYNIVNIVNIVWTDNIVNINAPSPGTAWIGVITLLPATSTQSCRSEPRVSTPDG